jgi:hypothetical protein
MFPFLPIPSEGRVQRHPVDPGADGCAAAKRIDGIPHLQSDLLKEILAIVANMHDPDRY